MYLRGVQITAHTLHMMYIYKLQNSYKIVEVIIRNDGKYATIT